MDDSLIEYLDRPIEDAAYQFPILARRGTSGWSWATPRSSLWPAPPILRAVLRCFEQEPS